MDRGWQPAEVTPRERRLGWGASRRPTGDAPQPAATADAASDQEVNSTRESDGNVYEAEEEAAP
jgi:hypothetical protein